MISVTNDRRSVPLTRSVEILDSLYKGRPCPSVTTRLYLLSPQLVTDANLPELGNMDGRESSFRNLILINERSISENYYYCALSFSR